VNIFALSEDPAEAARWTIDKHANKMVLETAQILSTISWQFGVPAPYKPTHARHPCTLWAAETYANWRWLLEHGLALSAEYRRRYEKTHASERVISWASEHGGHPERTLTTRTPFAQAMPDVYKREDPVLAYRSYYLGAKRDMASWKAPAEPPPWWNTQT